MSLQLWGRRLPGIGASKLVATAVIFTLCCGADALVLRTTWTGRQVAAGEFRRGYFESFENQAGLSVDSEIRYPMVPWFLLTDRGELAVPPGMTVVTALAPGLKYDVKADRTLAPYVVIGVEAPVAPVASHLALRPGEARLANGRTLALEDGRLTLAAWDAARPWSEDAARLSALHEGCAVRDATPTLTVNVSDGRLEIRLGTCSLTEPLPSSSAAPPLLAALAGPDWMTLARRPGWTAERWVIWPLLAVVILRVAATWWGAGLASAAAVSALLGGAAFRLPVATILTYPLAVAIGVAAAIIRLAVVLLRRLPSRWRAPVGLTALTIAGGAIALKARAPDSLPPIMHVHSDHMHPDTCAVVGYSTAAGASLRDASRRHSGILAFLDEDCARCRDKTGGFGGGGETLGWARDAYCTSPPSFGADGQVVFLGGVNDDFQWGVFSVARLLIVAEQGIEPWRRNQASAAAASLARIGAQAAALDDLAQCARSRHARFLFLHDFLVTDLLAGRDRDRAAMLARRRAVVEAAGGTFVDLLAVFGAEAGVSWFNDYVHPSLIAHERIANLACHTFL